MIGKLLRQIENNWAGNFREGLFGKFDFIQARDKNTNQIFAIKTVLQDKRYKNRELSIICKLDNPNVIKMIDYYFTIEGGVRIYSDFRSIISIL